MTNREIHTLRDFLAAYEDALAFLKDLRVDSRQGRLDDYRTRLRNAVLAEQKAPEASHAHQSDETFQYVLLEAREIIDIATLGVRFLQGRETLTKLRGLRKGQTLPDPTKDDPARNYAFEFSAAATAARRERLLGFEAGDFQIGPEGYPVECKRISSLARLGQNLRDAKNQLKARGRPGIIAIDLTSPIRAEQGLTRICSCELELRQSVDNELTAYLFRHFNGRALDGVIDPMVLGLIFHHRLIGSVGSPHEIRLARTWQAFRVHGVDNKLNHLFDAATSWLADGGRVEASEGDLVSAIRSVPVP